MSLAGEPPKRKRVTRVGSGAYSIYLPKKWIDAWLPEQRRTREVELRFISQSLLVSPVIIDRSHAATVAVDTEAVRMHLLSSYVRGHHRTTLRPPEGERFDNDCVTAARDFLRHLDERLVATSSPAAIGFTLDPDLPPPATTGADLLNVLGAKVREVIALAADAVRTYGHDPDRTLHTLRLLHRIHDEDVQRLFHQVLRLVATLEIPMPSVSEYQFLALAGAEMHQISGNAVKMANALLVAYRLQPRDLDYPRQHLLERMAPPAKLRGVAKDLVRAYKEPFEETQELLRRLTESFQRRDVAAMGEIMQAAPAAQDRLQASLFEAVVAHLGQATDAEGARAADVAGKIGPPLANILDSLRMISHHAVVLLTAAEAAP